MIAVNNQRDSVSPPPLAPKPKKGKSQAVTLTLPKSQGHEASGALSKKRKKSLSTVPDPQDLERHIQLASTRLPSTLNEGTRKLKPLHESTITYPKDLGGNDQPLDRDLTFMTFNEGITKTTPRLKGPRGDKDSRGNKPPADMEPQNPIDADLSRTGAKYQEDQTQSFRLSEEDIVGAGEEMDDNPQSTEASDTDSLNDKILKKYDDTCPLTERQLVKYLRKVDQTDQLVEASMSSIEKSSTTINDLYKGLDFITHASQRHNQCCQR
ncbi:hypothetical protein Tco_1238143 [Tanacetum coccineum]